MRMKDLSTISSKGFQQLWFQIKQRNLRSILICVVYRPPNCPISCLEEMLVPNNMTHALTLNKDFLIAGDLNCNLLSSNVDSSPLRGLCENFNLKQLITSPTRVSRHHESLIDVIISSNPTLIKDSGVKEITISDHFLVCTVLNLRKQKPRKSIMNVRILKTYVPDNFSSDIAQVPWQAFDFSSDIDEKVATFNNLFMDVLNQHMRQLRWLDSLTHST